MTRILYVDCFAGIAGDMTLGALIHLGQGVREAIDAALEALPLEGYRLETRDEARSGIAATRAIVDIDEDHHHRTHGDIRDMIAAAPLDPDAKERALAIFQVLAEAEAKVHHQPVDDVHFHEVGAVDSIVDVVGAAAGLAHLGAEVRSSRIPLGAGLIRCQHGPLPLPAPATLELLGGLPVYGTELDEELVTPTGAAILRSQAKGFGPLPAMRPVAVGWGAGSRDHEDRPGLLRLVLGEGDEARTHRPPCVVLEANVDDMTAEVAAHAMERALDAGALDAWIAPITMKKGRPAMQVAILARREDLDAMGALLMSETTTIGLRYHEVGRMELPRQMITVQTPWGEVPVKVSGHEGGPRTVAPEFDACRALALDQGLPVKDVLAAATAAALRQS